MFSFVISLILNLRSILYLPVPVSTKEKKRMYTEFLSYYKYRVNLKVVLLEGGVQGLQPQNNIGIYVLAGSSCCKLC